MKKKILSIIMIALLGLILVACSPDQGETSRETETSGEKATQTEKNTQSEGEEPSFSITVEVGEKTTKITEEKIGEIKETSLTATINSKNGEETNQYTGILLKDVLAYANIGEYTSLELEAADGYVVEYTKEMAESDGAILAYIVDGKIIGEEGGPIQSIIDGESAQNTVKQLVKIRAIK